ncbi:MAG: hypothetical protein ABII07_04225, partial [Patescibacteria group bacterium]|nr:hypothetical protein [Patescibacteria group bacterium]
MTDKQLFDLCRKYGGNAKMWQRKFAALLPEVDKRKLWKRKGFYSIYDFAAQIGGMSESAVYKILNLNKKLENKPLLKAEIEKQGWAKVEVAARIPVKEEEAVKMVQALPKQTLAVYAKDVMVCAGAKSESEKLPKLHFAVKPETELRLRKFRQELEKERKESITLGEALEELLNRAEQSKKTYKPN